MRFIFAFIFLWGAISTLSAQQTKPDSLIQQLQIATSDTNKINLMNELAWEYMTSEPEKTKKYAEEALALAEKVNFKRGEILALNYLGDYCRRQAQYAQAITYTTQSLKIAMSEKDSLGIADAYRLLGIVHSFSLHEYSKALKYQTEALKIYERHGNKYRTLGLYSNMSWVFCMMGKELPRAYGYTQKAILIAQEMKNDRFIGWAFNSMGLVFMKQEKLDSALFYLGKSNHYATSANDQAVMLYNQNLIGEIYLVQKQYEKAKITFSKNLIDIQKFTFNLLASDAYKGLAEVHTAQKRYDSAYWYYQKHIEIRDSLQNIETSEKIAIVEAGFAEERRQARIDYLEKERVVVSSIASLAFIALLYILFITARNNKQRKKTNEILQAKNQEIAQQNEELAQSQEEIVTQRDMVAKQNTELYELNEIKNKLFAIIGHDLRSPINSLKGLLKLLTEKHISIDEFFMFSEKLKIGVEHVYFTLNNLLLWANSQMHGIKPNPQNINVYKISQENTNLLFQTFADKNIQFANHIEEHLSVFADPDQVSLVFRNLISNAIKFSNQGSVISLSSKKVDNFCEIAVSDTGIGMDAETSENLFVKNTHFTTLGTSGEKGTGLGLLLCQEMIEANGGKIWVESKLEKGSTFFFTLPMNAH
jgi:two-component system, sensor histidine kinase and response regulator